MHTFVPVVLRRVGLKEVVWHYLRMMPSGSVGLAGRIGGSDLVDPDVVAAWDVP